jgi:prepilin-type N-terminal cleavage/methylation domain-containing protein
MSASAPNSSKRVVSMNRCTKPADSVACRGFSLLELTACTAIASIVIGIAVPHTVSFLNQLYLKGEATSVRLFIESAYAYALSSQQRVNVSLNQNTLQGLTESGEAVGRYSTRNRVTINPDSVSGRTLSFYPTIAASPATIQLSRSGHSCSVIISLRGRARVSC